MRHLALIGVSALSLLASAGVAVAGTPAHDHAAAKLMLTKCLEAVNGLQVGALRSRTPEVPKRNREQQVVRDRCDNRAIEKLAYAHQKDAPLEAARVAFFSLSVGVGDYGQYLVDVAFDKQDTSLLHEAIREIASGKAQAKVALKHLG
jgi:hypothetical protein